MTESSDKPSAPKPADPRGAAPHDPDEAERLRAVELVAGEARARKLSILGEVESSLPGPKGNRERFLWLSRGPAD